MKNGGMTSVSSQKFVGRDGARPSTFSIGLVVLLCSVGIARSTIAANYMNFGGDNTTAGTFVGLGATNPQPLVNAPPLGAPGGP
jgi:hypothetical protein